MMGLHSWPLTKDLLFFIIATPENKYYNLIVFDMCIINSHPRGWKSLK